MSRSKILIAVKHQLIARGIMHYLYHIFPDPEIEIVTIAQLLKHKNSKEKYALIIEPDLLTDPKAITIEKIYKNYNQSKIIALSSFELPLTLKAYFDKTIFLTDPEESLIEKLRCIYNCDENLTRAKGNSVLSEREKEILKYVAQGYTNKKISYQLSISPHTVITHRKNITSKLGIKTIAGLTIYAVLNGIITIEELNL